VARKLTFREWALEKGDLWWRGIMRAHGYCPDSRVSEEVYNGAMGHRKRVFPQKVEKKVEVTNADHGIGA